MTTPPHLEPFLDGSPLAIERIKLAWPALSTSDRATLLAILLADSSKEKRALRWTHHQCQVVDLALADESNYIRYLAAKHVSAPSKSEEGSASYVAAKARFENVRADSAALVRFAGQDADDNPFNGILTGELDDPVSFWKRPQTERLVLVCGVVHSGQKLANLLRWASTELLPSGAIALEEICVLIRDAPSELHSDWPATRDGEIKQTERARRLSPNVLKYEVLEMRLFALARNVAPIKEGRLALELPDCLKKHRDQIVAHDPWQTYLNLRKIVRLHDPDEQTEVDLPSVEIRDFEIPRDPENDAKIEAKRDEERERRRNELVQHLLLQKVERLGCGVGFSQGCENFEQLGK